MLTVRSVFTGHKTTIFHNDACRNENFFSGGSFMILGKMDNQRTYLVIVPDKSTAVGYMYILRINFLPFMQNRGPGMILQQDKAKSNAAGVAT
jgi:hypothetical protein